jgi:hypothetical protein
VSSHFGFWVVSGRVGSVIESSSVGSFWILSRIRSVIESSSVGSFQVSGRDLTMGRVGMVRSGPNPVGPRVMMGHRSRVSTGRTVRVRPVRGVIL